MNWIEKRELKCKSNDNLFCVYLFQQFNNKYMPIPTQICSWIGAFSQLLLMFNHFHLIIFQILSDQIIYAVCISIVQFLTNFFVLDSWFFINRLILFLLIFPPHFSNGLNFFRLDFAWLCVKNTHAIVCSWSVLFKLWTIWIFFDIPKLLQSSVWIFPIKRG